MVIEALLGSPPTSPTSNAIAIRNRATRSLERKAMVQAAECPGIHVKEIDVAKSQRKGSKEIRKPKKASPPKPNASNPSLKGVPVSAAS